jgi:hypothetical protein
MEDNLVNAKEFCDRLHRMIDASLRDLPQTLLDPPGRRPQSIDVERAKWLKSLSAADRALVFDALKHVGHLAVFRVLCVLDGSGSIKSSQDEFLRFELMAVTDDGSKAVLSHGDDGALHEMYPLAPGE